MATRSASWRRPTFGIEAAGWKPPEVFVAKGRDGKTDIWGIICRPRNFDPAEEISGDRRHLCRARRVRLCPRPSAARTGSLRSTDLGFIVVQIDGMGTANRSKAFHDVCWKNLKDAGFPDRILWHKAAAAKVSLVRPHRVGIYRHVRRRAECRRRALVPPRVLQGGRGQLRVPRQPHGQGLLERAVDGLPGGPVVCRMLQHRQRPPAAGKAVLIVGEMDNNVPPESTFRFVDALIKAGKDFDFLVVPGGGHGAGGTYGQRRLEDFLVRHLLGREPPDRNGGSSRQVSQAPSAGPEAPPSGLDLSVLVPAANCAGAVERRIYRRLGKPERLLLAARVSGSASADENVSVRLAGRTAGARSGEAWRRGTRRCWHACGRTFSAGSKSWSETPHPKQPLRR